MILIRVCAFLLNRVPFLDAITLLFLAGELSQHRGYVASLPFSVTFPVSSIDAANRYA